jgi:predicted HAD superfamily hydrolase
MHEQLHFDITELFARKIRKVFRETTFSEDHYEEEIKALYMKCMTELGNYRSVYNSETFFGAKLDKQLMWNDKVAAALNEFVAYTR